MAKVGYVKLHRQLQDHWLWNDKPFSKGQAWIDLILLAEHKEHKRLYKGEVKTYEAGTVNLSITKLGQRWGWSWRKVKLFIKALENDGMCIANVTTNDTTIKLVNYSKFQVFSGILSNEVQNEMQSEGQNEGQSEGHISNNVKNVKNVNKRRSGGKNKDDDLFQGWLNRRMAEQEAEQDGEEDG